EPVRAGWLWVGWCLYGLPRLAAVEGLGDVEIPHTGERGILERTGRRRAVEGEGGAIGVAGNDGGEHRVLDAERRADVGEGLAVGVVIPGQPFVVRDGDLRMAVAVGEAEVDRAVGADADGGVAVAAGAARNGADVPRHAVVAGDGEALPPGAAAIRNGGRSVPRDFDVPVQPAALGGPHRNGGAEGLPAVEADGALRRS